MNWLREAISLVDSRTQQLKKQAEVDKELSRISSDCPGIVAQFLLAEREVHQKNGARLSSMSIIEKANFAVEMMNDWDSKYSTIHTRLRQPNPCKELQQFLLQSYVTKLK